MSGQCRNCCRQVCLFTIVVSLLGVSAAAAQPPDVTPPTITAAATTAPNANGWYRAQRARAVHVRRRRSRIASVPPPSSSPPKARTRSITGTARDRAGNTATASVTLNIDKTAPVVTASRSPEAPASGWSTTPVTVTLRRRPTRCRGSRRTALTAPMTLATDRTNGSATGRATDLAGNVGTFKLTGINIDQRAPRITVTLTPPPSLRGFRTGPVTAHFTCTDARSGVAVCPPDQVFDSRRRARQTVTGTAIDHAGHSATVSKSFNIDATAPVIHDHRAREGPRGRRPRTTITGTVIDAVAGVATLTGNGQRLRVRRTAPSPTDRSRWRTARTRSRSSRRIAPATSARAHRQRHAGHGCTNLVPDPQFESGESGFTAQDDEQPGRRAPPTSPLEGAHSLRVAITGYGNNLWWVHDFTGGRASHVPRQRAPAIRSCRAHPSCSSARWCTTPMARPRCTAPRSAARLATRAPSPPTLTLDSTKPLETVRIRMYQEGSDPLSFTLDAASACLDVVAPPTGGGGGDPGGGGGDPGGGGGGAGTCTAPSGPSAYPGFTYQLPDRASVHLADRLHGRGSGIGGLPALARRGRCGAGRQSAVRVLADALGDHVPA